LRPDYTIHQDRLDVGQELRTLMIAG